MGWETAFADMFDTKKSLKKVIKRLKAMDGQRETEMHRMGDMRDHHDMVQYVSGYTMSAKEGDERTKRSRRL